MTDLPPKPRIKVVELDDHVARIATEHLRAGGGILRPVAPSPPPPAEDPPS